LFISGLASSSLSLNGDTFRYLFAHSARVCPGNIAQFDAKLVSSPIKAPAERMHPDAGAVFSGAHLRRPDGNGAA
jgi:hypothetical protein